MVSSLKSPLNDNLIKNPYKTNPIRPSRPNISKFLVFSVKALMIFYKTSDLFTISNNNIA